MATVVSANPSPWAGAPGACGAAWTSAHPTTMRASRSGTIPTDREAATWCCSPERRSTAPAVAHQEGA